MASAKRPHGGARSRTGTKPVGDRPRRGRARPGGWAVPALIGVGVLIVALLAVWRVWPALGGRSDTAPPIATLGAPDVHALLVDPADPNRLLFGAHSGLWESGDGGFTWRAGALAGTDAMAMATSPSDPATFFVAGHDVFQVSHDGGTTWQPVVHDLPSTDLHGFAQDAADSRRLSAFVAGVGLFGSADGGAAWAPLPSQPPGLGMHAAMAAGDGVLYVATEAGIAASRDRGATWETLAPPPGGMVLSLAVSPATPGTIYAGTATGLAKSTDGGARWLELGPDDVPILAVAVAPSDPDRLVAVSDARAVYRSDDGGTSWRPPR